MTTKHRKTAKCAVVGLLIVSLTGIAVAALAATQERKPLGNNGLGIDFSHELEDGTVVEGTIGLSPVVLDANGENRPIRLLVPTFRGTKDGKEVFRGMAWLAVPADARSSKGDTLIHGSSFEWGFVASPREPLTWREVVTHHDLEVTRKK